MATGAKKKIMSLAKEQGVAADDLVRVLNEAGVDVKSPFSTVEPNELDKVKSQIEKLKTKAKSKSSISKPAAGGLKKNDSSDNDKEESGSKKLMGATIKVKKAGARPKASNTEDRASSIFKTKAIIKKPEVKPEEAPKVKPNIAPKVNIEEKAKGLFKEPSSEATTSAPKAEAKATFVDSKENKAIKSPKVENTHKSASTDKPVRDVRANKALSDAVVSESAVMNNKQSLKVKVEKPTQEMADRIAKYKTNPRGGQGGQGGQNRGGQGGRGGQNRGPGGQGGNTPGRGYTGNFSTPTSSGPGAQGGPGGQGGQNRGPGGQGGQNRGPGGPGGNRGPGGPGANRGPGAGSSGPNAANDRNKPRNNSMANAFNQSSAPAAPAAGAPNAGQLNTANRALGKDKGKKKKKFAKVIPERQINVRQNVSRVMASLSKNPGRKVYKKDVEEGDFSEERKILKVSDFVTLNELAGLMNVMPNMVMAKCMELGMMVTINHRIDFETSQMVADEFGYEAELMDEYEEEIEKEEDVVEGDLTPRPPVVTVMGHVDHGKTSLLDWIRKEKVAAGEAGGITQHVGAYSVSTPQGNVTFLDTPGHEAFTAMRARGSQVTDVVVLVVAADDRVMPQTIESIEHARAAKVPIVVAINKCDREVANPDKIRSQLAEFGVEVEQFGGNVSCIEVSAKTGLGMEKLLETLALETEILQLRANANSMAKGTVVESRLDKGKGAVATVLIQSGTLKVGDNFVVGIHTGKVRALLSTTGLKMESAGPGIPCQIMGLDGAPFSGDKLTVYADERSAKEIGHKRSIAAKERELRSRRHMTLDQLYDRVKAGSFTELNVIVKADVDGSAEAISNELEKISNKEVKVNVIRKAVGNINESDVMLASASDAIIVAFHLLPAAAVRDLADSEGVELKQYRIIYEIIEEFRGVVEGMLKPTFREEVVGEAKILQLFKITGVGWIAGTLVTNGAVDKQSQMRIYRNGIEIGSGKVSSLKRHQDDAASVKAGFECGIGINGFEGMKEEDTLAFFKTVEVKRTLKDVESE